VLLQFVSQGIAADAQEAGSLRFVPARLFEGANDQAPLLISQGWPIRPPAWPPMAAALPLVSVDRAGGPAHRSCRQPPSCRRGQSRFPARARCLAMSAYRARPHALGLRSRMFLEYWAANLTRKCRSTNGRSLCAAPGTAHEFRPSKGDSTGLCGIAFPSLRFGYRAEPYVHAGNSTTSGLVGWHSLGTVMQVSSRGFHQPCGWGSGWVDLCRQQNLSDR
jgi:hypothetical protein